MEIWNMVHRKKLEAKTFLDIIIAYKNSKGAASETARYFLFFFTLYSVMEKPKCFNSAQIDLTPRSLKDR